MAPRLVSLLLAAATLAGSLFLYTCSLWIYGPMLVYPILGAPAVVVMMALRASIVRRLGGPDDPLAHALEVIALGAMVAPSVGWWTASFRFARCSDVMDATVVGRSWPLWIAGEVFVFAALARRRAALAQLRGHQAVATILALIVAPPLVVLACITTCVEMNNAGAGVTFLLPAALATGSTLVSWTLGRSFATGTVLRRVVAAASILGAPVFLALRSREPLPHTCMSFWTTTTWGLLADVGWAAAPCLATMLYFARDPIRPTTGGLA